MHSMVVSCKSGYHIKDLREKIFDIASQVKESIGVCEHLLRLESLYTHLYCLHIQLLGLVLDVAVFQKIHR